MTCSATFEEDSELILDGEMLESKLGFMMRLCQVRIFEDFIKRLSRLELRPAEFSVLCLIDENPGCSASQIAEYLSIRRPNFVHLLSTLEARELVVRQQNETDRRIHDLFLTKAGQSLATKAKRLAAQQDEFMTAHLGVKKRHELMAMLQQIQRIDFNL